LGKNLKLNIKNTQLAEALKSKKSVNAEPAAPLKTQESAAAEEPKKLATRLKEDAAVMTALKQADKTLAAREKKKKL